MHRWIFFERRLVDERHERLERDGRWHEASVLDELPRALDDPDLIAEPSIADFVGEQLARFVNRRAQKAIEKGLGAFQDGLGQPGEVESGGLRGRRGARGCRLR